MKNAKKISQLVCGALASVLLLTSCSSAPSKPTQTPSSSPVSTPSSTPLNTVTPETDFENMSFKQSPFLDDKGLAAVKERLPKEPKIANEFTDEFLVPEIGNYGGMLRTVTAVIDYNADMFIMCNEALLNTPNLTGEQITPNILKKYTMSKDQKEFTFTMREGMKWSDGIPVTMDDFKFAINDILMNPVYTPVLPVYMKSGNRADGTPFKFNVLDDWSFQIIFDEPYGGFLTRMAISGWQGYTPFLKPAHYLKQFHKDYGKIDEIKAKAEELAIADDDQLFNKVFVASDVTKDDITKKRAIGFPVLYPWVMTKTTADTYYYERNPYYYKIDAAGNQLPYIDEVESLFVQDMEMVTMKVLAGDVDLARESVALVNMPMYIENEKHGYKALLNNIHNVPTNVFLNMTYDDDTWQEVTQNKTFREALNLALNKEEIIETIYYGHAEPADLTDAVYDVDKANKLLDEIGMDKKDSGNMRLAPNGKPFNFTIEVGAEAPDIVPLAELVVEMWREVGIDVSMKRIESTLRANKVSANEIQSTAIWVPTTLWYQANWEFQSWGRSWDAWQKSLNTADIKEADGTVRKVNLNATEPPAAVKEIYNLVDKMMTVPVDEALVIKEDIHKNFRENIWYFSYMKNVKQPLIVNQNMGNVSDKSFAIAVNAAAEILYYK